ncbi:SRPBCC family protein [Nocardioides caldifontis]|uniref:SRPBCC family protein n=1 Tax=Nocardioides caldifontis TaxID=2588938 RepID=UPI0011DF8080|nr:SRPBCC family protein [Nocardioides caldifontis]
MELTHSFTVPVDKATAWATFQDIGSVAECFPGATVTSVEEDSFKGTVKVKLGPIALQYSGQGTFIERDEDAGRMVLDAKGKDKRGNGTAGAKVTATFVPEGDSSTRVEVVTDLQVTGKPAQFGRGVMQDVSDKLLGQFVDCLESKVGGSSSDVTAEAAAAVGGSGSVEPPLVADPPSSGEPPLAADPPVLEEPEVASATPPPTAGGAGSRSSVTSGAAAGAAGARSSSPPDAARSSDDAIDLGATVLPVLLRSYGKPVGLAALGLLVLVWLLRRRRS